MPMLLELYRFWTVQQGAQAELCPVCGHPLEPGQEVLGFVDRWTRGYYVVHEWCEAPLHELLRKEQEDDRNLQFAS